MSRHNPELRSLQKELALIDAFAGNVPRPYWLLRIEQAEPRLDILGVDSIAHVRYPGGDIVRVPIQVKGTLEHVEEYYRRHPEAQRARVVVMVYMRGTSSERIRKQLIDHIITLRQCNIRFDAYFASLEQRPLSYRMRNMISQITTRRAAFSPQTLVPAQ